MRAAALAAAALFLGAAGCVKEMRQEDGVSLLVSAAQEGRLPDLRYLLSRGFSPNMYDASGRSPLGAACMYGRTEAVAALLDAGARFDQPERDKYRTMPLLLAVFNNHPDTARVLMNRGASLSGAANGGDSALMRAVRGGRLDQVRMVLDLGADANEADSQGQSPIQLATYANRPDIVKALVAAGAPPIGVLGRVGLALAADEKGKVVAKTIIAGSAAEKAGIKAGDRVVSIDGTDAESMTVSQAVARLRGEAGTVVKVGVSRGGSETVFEIAREGVGVAAAPPPGDPSWTAPKSPRAPYAIASDVDSPARTGAERPDDFALVVGVEEYQSLPKAQFGARDAQAVRRQLAALGIPERNIVALEGSGATKSKLQSYLQEWLPLNVRPDSTLWVYYSGHGAPDAKSGDAYLVPWDGDPKFLKSTAYPLKQFYADLAKTKAKRVVVALDACFSGAGGRSVLAEGTRPLVVKVDEGAPSTPRLTVLAAASGDETTGTLADQGHGAFTYFFLKGLSGAAKDAAGRVTPKSLYDYLRPRVQDEAHRQNREQTPTMRAGDADQPLD